MALIYIAVSVVPLFIGREGTSGSSQTICSLNTNLQIPFYVAKFALTISKKKKDLNLKFTWHFVKI